MRQTSLINAFTLQLKSEFTVMVKLAHWSNEYYFYIQKLRPTSNTHEAQQTSFAKIFPAAQPDTPDEINSTGI